jgi:hypothetical protein
MVKILKDINEHKRLVVKEYYNGLFPNSELDKKAQIAHLKKKYAAKFLNNSKTQKLQLNTNMDTIPDINTEKKTKKNIKILND